MLYMYMLYLLVNHAFLFSAGDLKKKKEKEERNHHNSSSTLASVAPPLIVDYVQHLFDSLSRIQVKFRHKFI